MSSFFYNRPQKITKTYIVLQGQKIDSKYKRVIVKDIMFSKVLRARLINIYCIQFIIVVNGIVGTLLIIFSSEDVKMTGRLILLQGININNFNDDINLKCKYMFYSVR